MIKAVIFDLDGTVLDTLPDLNACMNEALEKFGCPRISMEETRRYVGHGGLRFAELSLPEDRRAQAEHFYKDVYCPVHFACKNALTKVFEGEADCLAALRAAGIKLAIVTNKSQPAATALAQTLLAPYGFSVVFGNRDGIPVKPDPASTFEVLKQLGVSPEEAVFVGDGDTDVQTAANAGMRCVSVLWGYRSREQLVRAGASLFAESFPQLKEMLLKME